MEKLNNILALKEDELVPFLEAREAIAMFADSGQNFVGDIAKIEYEAVEGIAYKLKIRFKWIVEIGNMCIPKNGGIAMKDCIKSFHRPHVVAKTDETLVCLHGESTNQKLTISKKTSHRIVVGEIGTKCGMNGKAS